MKVLKKSELCGEKPSRPTTYGDLKPGDIVIDGSFVSLIIKPHKGIMTKKGVQVGFVYLKNDTYSSDQYGAYTINPSQLIEEGVVVIPAGTASLVVPD